LVKHSATNYVQLRIYAACLKKLNKSPYDVIITLRDINESDQYENKTKTQLITRTRGY
jgi:hypothetical protein